MSSEITVSYESIKLPSQIPKQLDAPQQWSINACGPKPTLSPLTARNNYLLSLLKKILSVHGSETTLFWLLKKRSCSCLKNRLSSHDYLVDFQFHPSTHLSIPSTVINSHIFIRFSESRASWGPLSETYPDFFSRILGRTCWQNCFTQVTKYIYSGSEILFGDYLGQLSYLPRPCNMNGRKKLGISGFKII